MRFLVTAGNTREMIDRVRAWSNIFTGNTGCAIARELAKRGEVDLFTSNAEHVREIRSARSSIDATLFGTHAELKSLLADALKGHCYDAVFMTAAVADYSPIGAFAVIARQSNADGSETWTVRDAQSAKIKSIHKTLAILGEPTEKLIDLFRRDWKFSGLLVKFKLEVAISEDELKKVAEASRVTSGADFIVANTLEMVQGDSAGAWLLGPQSAEWIERGSLSRRLAELAIRARH